MRKATRILAVLIAASLYAATGPVGAQSPVLSDLLDRATAYVEEFFRGLSNVVAEEHYVQQAESPTVKRVLRSDFLLVTFPGLQGNMSFRDVFEVDGRPVRNASQQDRLIDLFGPAQRDVMSRVREITQESDRYSLADIGTLADPLDTLGFLQTNFRSRFRFVLGGLERGLGLNVRTVRFEEWQRPTVLRAGQNDLPGRGLIWIEETTGRVVKTELLLGLRSHRSDIVTTYRWDDELQVNVPAEMRDSHQAPSSKRNLRGLATYSRFRRFQVHTEETIR